jgi:RNA polymerase sigma factor (sigma-70 family)
MTHQLAADPRPDAALILACQQGDRESFRWLYRRHQQFVRITLQHLCDPTTLDDLVQEVFVRAWRGIGTMRQEAQFSTWLYRIAWNVGADYRRKKGQHQQKQAQLLQVGADVPEPDWKTLHYQDLVRRGLAQLSDDQAMVLILHDLQDLPQTDVARTLNIPVGTVKSRLFHARNQLRRFFDLEGVSL